MDETAIITEQQAADAFTRQSGIFDALYSSNIIIQYKRKRVREHAEKFVSAGSLILELNAGTGEDAVYFAQQSHRVHATDISEGMQQMLKDKVESSGLVQSVTTELCSFNSLENLVNKGPYDFIFSNFAGLNCTGELDKVLKQFPALLKPGGFVTLVIMPPFCLWETLLALKGSFKIAFRRFHSSKGAPAHIEGKHFLCWYYKPSFIANCLKNDFDIMATEGLCSIVPPSYFENFPKKFPRLYNGLIKAESRMKTKWPWKNCGDYFIITLRKKDKEI